MANRFVLNETSYHGKGAIKEIPTEAKARGFKKAMVCSDPDLIKFGVTKKVTDLLDEAGLDYVVYSDTLPHYKEKIGQEYLYDKIKELYEK